VLSGRGLCDELITRPEESYRLWRVVVCDLETSKEAKSPLKGYEYKPTVGCDADNKSVERSDVITNCKRLRVRRQSVVADYKVISVLTESGRKRKTIDISRIYSQRVSDLNQQFRKVKDYPG
jgi:hypothetical protein